MKKICRICGKEFEIVNQYGHNRQFCYDCVPENLSWSDRTKVKRQAAKQHAIELVGGKCLKCGETKSYLIDFHHVVSEEKEHNFATLLGDSQFEDYFKELEKAIPLCSNCHREFHYLEREQSISIEQFLRVESISFYKNDLDRSYSYVEKTESILTNTPKPIRECKANQVVEIEDYELVLNKIRETSYTEVANEYGISANALKKRLKTRGYPYLIKDIKGVEPKKEKVLGWRDLPLTLIKEEKEYYFDTGRKAIEFITEEENGIKDRVSEGLNRLVTGKRNSYLGYTILKLMEN